MTKKSIYIGIALCVVLVIGLIFFFTRGQSTPATSISTTTPVASVSVLNKDIRVQSQGLTKSVASSTSLVLNDVVQTLDTGRALIQSNDGDQTLLDYSSKMTIVRNDPDGSHQSNFLAVGAAWARVKKVFGQGEFYEIETQNAVAVVRGTSFGIRYINKQTILEVTEGSVAFLPVDPITRVRNNQRETLVTAGQKATVDDLGNVYISKITTTDQSDNWFQYNNPTTATETPPATTTTPPKQTTPTGTTVQPPATPPAGTVAPATVPLTITSLSPTSVVAGARVYFKGSGFSKVTAVVIGRQTLPAGDVTITSDSALNISTQSISGGTYDVSVIDVSQHIFSLSSALTVTDAPPPPPPPTQTYYNQLQ